MVPRLSLSRKKGKRRRKERKTKKRKTEKKTEKGNGREIEMERKKTRQ